MHDLKELCKTATELAITAGNVIMEHYTHGASIDVKRKADHSPVTAADMAAHEVICLGLKQAYPDIPILSEEAANIDFATRRTWNSYWLVDPLDGTREFLKGNGEFTVNIALISDHKPMLGIVYAPVFDLLYYASEGNGAYKQSGDNISSLHTRSTDINVLTITSSRSHSQSNVTQFMDSLPNSSMVPMGSSLKTCYVAEGCADIYPRLGPTSEWDTGAAQCVLFEAGGAVIDVTGADLRYNTKSSLLNPWFLAVGDTSIDWVGLIPDDLTEQSV